MDDAIETLRRRLVEHLTSRTDTAWTVTSQRFLVRRGGRLIGKIGRDASHVLVEFPLPRDDRTAARAAIEQSGFVGPAPPGEANPDRWRQARVTDDAQLETVLGWLLPD